MPFDVDKFHSLCEGNSFNVAELKEGIVMNTTKRLWRIMAGLIDPNTGYSLEKVLGKSKSWTPKGQAVSEHLISAITEITRQSHADLVERFEVYKQEKPGDKDFEKYLGELFSIAETIRTVFEAHDHWYEPPAKGSYLNFGEEGVYRFRFYEMKTKKDRIEIIFNAGNGNKLYKPKQEETGDPTPIAPMD